MSHAQMLQMILRPLFVPLVISQSYIWRLKVTRFIVIFAFVFRSVEQHLRILKTSTQLMESLNVLSVQVWRSDAGGAQ